MKSIIIYTSTHHGNTEKLAKAISEACGVELLDATKESKKDLSEYDLIGFASGIYAGRYHPTILKFAAENLPLGKKIFFMSTSAMNKPFTKSIQSAVADKNADIAGEFHCGGYNTFGPFKLIGGTNKGRPNEEDIKSAVEFYKGICQ